MLDPEDVPRARQAELVSELFEHLDRSLGDPDRIVVCRPCVDHPPDRGPFEHRVPLLPLVTRRAGGFDDPAEEGLGATDFTE